MRVLLNRLLVFITIFNFAMPQTTLAMYGYGGFSLGVNGHFTQGTMLGIPNSYHVNTGGNYNHNATMFNWLNSGARLMGSGQYSNYYLPVNVQGLGPNCPPWMMARCNWGQNCYVPINHIASSSSSSAFRVIRGINSWSGRSGRSRDRDSDDGYRSRRREKSTTVVETRTTTTSKKKSKKTVKKTNKNLDKKIDELLKEIKKLRSDNENYKKEIADLKKKVEALKHNPNKDSLSVNNFITIFLNLNAKVGQKDEPLPQKVALIKEPPFSNLKLLELEDSLPIIEHNIDPVRPKDPAQPVRPVDPPFITETPSEYSSGGDTKESRGFNCEIKGDNPNLYDTEGSHCVNCKSEGKFQSFLKQVSEIISVDIFSENKEEASSCEELNIKEHRADISEEYIKNNFAKKFDKHCGTDFTEFYEYMKKEAEEAGVPPEILLGMINAESGVEKGKYTNKNGIQEVKWNCDGVPIENCTGYCTIEGDPDENGILQSVGLFQISLKYYGESSKSKNGGDYLERKSCSPADIRGASLADLKGAKWKHCAYNPVANLRLALRALKEKFHTVNKHGEHGVSLRKGLPHVSWFRERGQGERGDFGRRYRDLWRKALSAYNGGQGHVSKAFNDYKVFITNHYDELKELIGREPSVHDWEVRRLMMMRRHLDFNSRKNYRTNDSSELISVSGFKIVDPSTKKAMKIGKKSGGNYYFENGSIYNKNGKKVSGTYVVKNGKKINVNPIIGSRTDYNSLINIKYVDMIMGREGDNVPEHFPESYAQKWRELEDYILNKLSKKN